MAEDSLKYMAEEQLRAVSAWSDSGEGPHPGLQIIFFLVANSHAGERKRKREAFLALMKVLISF